MVRRTLLPEGSWYKGNLHTHTTCSDGSASPQETAEAYRRAGYAFLAITDHFVYGRHEKLGREDFLLFPGVEFDSTADFGNRSVHLVAVGTPEDSAIEEGCRFEQLRGRKIGEIAAYMTARDHLTVLAHPYWSWLDFSQALSFEGLTGMEIFNGTCEASWFSGQAQAFFHQMLWNGRRPLCFASDDTHQFHKDFGWGYITVKAPRLTHQAIRDAILAGSFTATAAYPGEEGPRILDFAVEDDTAVLTASPCRSLYIYSGWGDTAVHGTRDEPVSRLTARIPAGAPFVSAMCVDFAGHITWSQPIFGGTDS